jgi:hypothetical protein
MDEDALLASRSGCVTPIGQEAAWAPGQVSTRKTQAPTGNRTSVVQITPSHYTDWATAAPFCVVRNNNLTQRMWELNVLMYDVYET